MLILTSPPTARPRIVIFDCALGYHVPDGTVDVGGAVSAVPKGISTSDIIPPLPSGSPPSPGILFCTFPVGILGINQRWADSIEKRGPWILDIHKKYAKVIRG